MKTFRKRFACPEMPSEIFRNRRLGEVSLSQKDGEVRPSWRGIGEFDVNRSDFKYMMQDLYRLYFGIKCTYSEILENEDAYYKFKAICRQYLITEVDGDTTLESHLYHLTPEDPCAKVYEAIGARVKLSLPGVQKGLFGKEHKIFREEIWKVEDLMALSAQQKQFRGIVLTELQIPKIRLREFAV